MLNLAGVGTLAASGLALPGFAEPAWLDDARAAGSHFNTSSISRTAISQAFRDIQKHEEEHVKLIQAALGSSAIPEPDFDPAKFQMPNVRIFALVSQALENTGCGAYLGALPFFSAAALGSGVVTAAAGIAEVEARHAGFLNLLTGMPILTPADADPFSRDKPLPCSSTSPLPPDVQSNTSHSDTVFGRLTGNSITAAFLQGKSGPITPPACPAQGDDAGILNFALFLEYTERFFYDVNVPRFFRH